MRIDATKARIKLNVTKISSLELFFFAIIPIKQAKAYTNIIEHITMGNIFDRFVLLYSTFMFGSLNSKVYVERRVTVELFFCKNKKPILSYDYYLYKY